MKHLKMYVMKISNLRFCCSTIPFLEEQHQHLPKTKRIVSRKTGFENWENTGSPPQVGEQEPVRMLSKKVQEPSTDSQRVFFVFGMQFQ